MEVQFGWFDDPADQWSNYGELVREWIDVTAEFGTDTWGTKTWNFEVSAADEGVGKNWYLWLKGESSGNIQTVHDVRTDCDADTILIKISQKGAACHKGYKSCFFRGTKDGSDWEITGEPLFDPEEVYGKKS